MLKKVIEVLLVCIAVFIIFPVIVFITVISIQEGCFVCFDGDGRGGIIEKTFNFGLLFSILALSTILWRAKRRN